VANGADGGLGSFGVPADATAVVLNVTAVGPAAIGHLTVFPTGAAQPLASNLNYAAGQNIPNLVEVGLGTGGDVSIFSLAATDLVVDVEGYVAPTAAGGAGAGLYNPLSSPARICDTRAASAGSPANQCTGQTLGLGGTINVAVTGSNGIPAGATAAVLNVTAVGPGAQGFLTVYPQGGTRPTASNVNYVAGKVSANRVTVPLSASGKITIFSAQPADVVVDVSGYYSAAAGTGDQFSAESAPVRICDTRAASAGSPANQCTGLTIAPAGTLPVQVTGLAGVPDNATAVVVNLTAVDPSAQTFLTLSATGKILIYNNAGNTNVVVDVLGWYS
jgi:hypothetical protein